MLYSQYMGKKEKARQQAEEEKTEKMIKFCALAKELEHAASWADKEIASNKMGEYAGAAGLEAAEIVTLPECKGLNHVLFFQAYIRKKH